MDSTMPTEIEPWQCPVCPFINKKWQDFCESCFEGRWEKTENMYHIQLKLDSSQGKDEKEEQEILRVVIVGKTGNGKSSLARSLSGSEMFHAQMGATSCTRNCVYDSGYVDNIRVEVVDTPGLFDTCLSHQEPVDQISKCCLLSAPGPHAFLVTLGFHRFTQEESQALAALEQLFGKEFYKYVVVVFTGYDSLANSKTPIDSFIRNVPESLRTVLDSCNGRYTYIDNTGAVEDSKEGARRILGLVKEIKDGNLNGYFSNDLFNKAESIVKEREEEISRNEQFYMDNQAHGGVFRDESYAVRNSREGRNTVRRDIERGKAGWLKEALVFLRPLVVRYIHDNRGAIANFALFALQRLFRI